MLLQLQNELLVAIKCMSVILICLIKYSKEDQINYVEQLESVAYVLCGEEKHFTYQHFAELWKARGVGSPSWERMEFCIRATYKTIILSIEYVCGTDSR